jgi:MarR family transcriptional regulator, organic hydroperoxide resistance regulator
MTASIAVQLESNPTREQQFLRTLWRLNHSIEARSKLMESTLGVTFQQRTVLRLVGQFPGISAGELATYLHVDPGTVSATLRRLQARGFLARRRDVEDRRRVLLELTARGERLDVAVKGTVEQAVGIVLERVSDQRLDAMLELLGALVHRLDTSPLSEPKAVPRRAKRAARR